MDRLYEHDLRRDHVRFSKGPLVEACVRRAVGAFCRAADPERVYELLSDCDLSTRVCLYWEGVHVREEILKTRDELARELARGPATETRFAVRIVELLPPLVPYDYVRKESKDANRAFSILADNDHDLAVECCTMLEGSPHLCPADFPSDEIAGKLREIDRACKSAIEAMQTARCSTLAALVWGASKAGNVEELFKFVEDGNRELLCERITRANIEQRKYVILGIRDGT